MKKKRILIVDDEKAIRAAMAVALKSVEYEIDLAENGIQAIDYLDRISYDLIITDYSMPEMDGLELTRIITSRYPAMPILMVTGAKIDHELLRGRNMIFLPKPFNVLELQNQVECILNGFRNGI